MGHLRTQKGVILANPSYTYVIEASQGPNQGHGHSASANDLGFCQDSPRAIQG